MKILSRFYMAIFLFGIFVIPAYGVLPAVAFLFAQSVLESFIVRSVARQSVVIVRTASNDSTWASTFSDYLIAARAIGSLSFNVNNLQGASVPITSIEILVSPLAENDLTFAEYEPTVVSYNYEGISGLTLNLFMANYVAAFNSSGSQIIHAWECNYDERPSRCRYSTTPNDPYNGGGSFTASTILDDLEARDGIGRFIGSVGNWSADSTDPDWTAAQLLQYKNIPWIRFSGNVAGKISVIDLSKVDLGLKIGFVEQVSPSHIRLLDTFTNISYVPIAFNSSFIPGLIPSTLVNLNIDIPPLNFPTDLAKQGEAASAAGLIKSTLDSIALVFTNIFESIRQAIVGNPTPSQQAILLNSNPTNSNTDSMITALFEQQQVDENVLYDFFSWSPPGAVACSPFGGVVGGYNIYYDLCPTFENIKSVLGWIFAIYTLWMLFGLVVNRK